MSTGLRIARIQPPHHGHIDAIQQALDFWLKKIIIGIGSANISHTSDNPFSADERQYMIQTLLDKHGLTSYTQIHHLPDFPDDTQRTQHIIQTIPDFTHVISDNTRVNSLFHDKIIIQPQTNLPVRASVIRQAIIQQQDHILQQFLSPEIINYLTQIDGYQRIKSLKQ